MCTSMEALPRLQCMPRTELGKTASDRERRMGRVIGYLKGDCIPDVPLTVNQKELHKLLITRSYFTKRLMELEFPSGEIVKVRPALCVACRES